MSTLLSEELRHFLKFTPGKTNHPQDGVARYSGISISTDRNNRRERKLSVGGSSVNGNYFARTTCASTINHSIQSFRYNSTYNILLACLPRTLYNYRASSLAHKKNAKGTSQTLAKKDREEFSWPKVLGNAQIAHVYSGINALFLRVIRLSPYI